MNRRVILPCILVTVAALGVGGWFVFKARTPSGTAPPPEQGVRIEMDHGATVLVVPADMQRASGLAVERLAAGTAPQETPAYASVVDVQPLIDLATRMAAARAERDVVRAGARVSQAQAARMRTLFQDDRNVAQKAVQEAQAAEQVDAARLAAAEATLASLGALARQQFGGALADAAVSASASAAWRALVAGRAAVVRVVLRAGAAPGTLAIEAADGGSVQARHLSAAPQVDPLLQGAAHFYLADAPLPLGTRTLARVARSAAPGPGAARQGVLVPDAAIVWYGDMRWVYVRAAAERFVRRPIEPAAPVDGGVLAGAGVRAGEDVVTRGAALLLSEEARPRGIATQCKDPPECDD